MPEVPRSLAATPTVASGRISIPGQRQRGMGRTRRSIGGRGLGLQHDQRAVPTPPGCSSCRGELRGAPPAGTGRSVEGSPCDLRALPTPSSADCSAPSQAGNGGGEAARRRDVTRTSSLITDAGEVFDLPGLGTGMRAIGFLIADALRAEAARRADAALMGRPHQGALPVPKRGRAHAGRNWTAPLSW